MRAACLKLDTNLVSGNDDDASVASTVVVVASHGKLSELFRPIRI
jgi:hypothetical protein